MKAPACEEARGYQGTGKGRVRHVGALQEQASHTGRDGDEGTRL